MTDVRTATVGTPVPSPTLVQCDQETVVGDGSHGNPLRAGPSSGGIGIIASPFPSDLPVGSPVVVFGGVGPGGLPVVGLPIVLPEVAPIGISAGAAYGVVSAVLGDGTVRVSPIGTVTLTTAQWDAVTAQSGGLTAGLAYYCASTSGAPPSLSTTPPPAPGFLRTKVGVALSATTLLVLTSAPQVNEEDQLAYSSAFVAGVNLGNVVVAGSAGHYALASTGSVSAAQAVGVVATFASSEPVVQLAGAVVLATNQWDAVTGGSGGLTPGAAYYVSTTPGHLTAIAPTTGPKVQVGVGFSPTTLVLSPFLQTF